MEIMHTGMVQAYKQSEFIGNYVAVIAMGSDAKARLSIYQPVVNRQYNTSGLNQCGSWYVSTILDGGRISDNLSLDHGQGWYVKGMLKFIREYAG